jgi:hypothetical protein
MLLLLSIPLLVNHGPLRVSSARNSHWHGLYDINFTNDVSIIKAMVHLPR